MNKIIDIISLFAPFILVSVFVFMSIFNQDLKALFLLGGIFFMIYILKQVTKNNTPSDENQFVIYCSMFNTLETPGTSTAIISFIFMYMLLPMIYNNQYNLLILISIALTWILDIYHKLFQYNCFEKSLGLIATLIGLAAGSGFFFSIYNLGEEYYNFLYFNVSKNNLVQCNKNDNTEYHCTFEDENGNTETTDMTASSVAAQQGSGEDEDDPHKPDTNTEFVNAQLQAINRQISALLNVDKETDGVHVHDPPNNWTSDYEDEDEDEDEE